jgi:hypothetical protein
MLYKRVQNSWVFVKPDNNKDIKVIVTVNIIVSTFRTFVKRNH